MVFPTNAGTLSPLSDYVPVLISCLSAVTEIDSAWSNPVTAREYLTDLINALDTAL